eukprot:jgi/Tetstr1/440436/TSEL_028769.t1
MTHQLRRELEWWLAVPSHSNGRSIYKPVETAYAHIDSSGYGWGAVLIQRDHRGARFVFILDSNDIIRARATSRPRRTSRPTASSTAH